ncbi:hypothetical protein INR75_09310 [Zunongwangia sp. SCSIO 43204]|uniref:hypothetical protein n=1 Tax=Zunongwangia sp. SCSIO 43204 TaxID=2779359 RepID=UPI001CA8FAF1|nr:hypothetical protein [Zunongwangia sp. SCSIO 43204]UAB86169.1 hypothetical protein INR75_09310 [Zunongwangia sp. SCSIO 43204]
MIILHRPEFLERNEEVVISSTILIDDKTDELWFKLPTCFSKSIVTERLDAFTVAVLFYALEHHKDIHVKGEISQRLLHNLNNYLIDALCLSNSHFKKIKITSDYVSGSNLCNQNVGATGISCGVDSFSTFFKHFQEDKPFKIEYLTFFNVGSHGDFGGEKARRIFKERFEQAKEFAKDINLPIIKVDSNLSEFLKLNFLQTNTLRNVACILLLQKAIKNYYLASKNRYDFFKLNPKDNQDFDTLLLPLLSTESTTIHSAVSNLKRTERTLFISEFPLTYKHLDVCTNPNASINKNNCSVCSKCMRTQLTFDLYGRLSLYEPVFHLEKYFGMRDSYIAQVYNSRNLDPFSIDLFELIKEKNALKPKHIVLAKYIVLKNAYTAIKKNVKKTLNRK